VKSVSLHEMELLLVLNHILDLQSCNVNLLTYLDPSVLVRTMGSKSSSSVPVCGHSPDAVPVDSSVHKVFFECGPACLCWPTSFPSNVNIMAIVLLSWN